MQLIKIFLCVLFVSGCSYDEKIIDEVPPISAPKPTVEKCVSNFMKCESYADLILGDGPNQPIGTWIISAYFPGDETGLSFFFEGSPDDIKGKIRLNDTRTERAQAPYAVRSIEKNEDESVHWLSMGDTIDISYPSPDVVKIVYDINTTLRKGGQIVDKEMRYKGEIVAPILARCYNDTGEGTGTGILDPNFSSEFCSQFKKHQYQF